MSNTNHWEHRGLYRKFTDKVSGNEVLEANFSLQGDARFDDIRYIINDFTEISDFEVSHVDITKISAIDTAASISNPSIKIAIISAMESLLIWAQLYCEHMEKSPYECQIFNSVSDAYEWVAE